MLIARIQGSANATRKHPSLAGWRLLVCQGVGATGQDEGDPFIALDQLGAGRGDYVVVTSDGKGMRERIGITQTPARWFTIGLVDDLDDALLKVGGGQ